MSTNTKSNITLSLDTESKTKLRTLSGIYQMTMSDLVALWIEREFDEQDSFMAIEATNPIIDMIELDTVRRKFTEAVNENLVMTFDEYVRRFGDGGEGGKTACEPFVYVGAGDGGYEEGRIVSDSCVFADHEDIISVWGQNSVYGYPRLLVSEEDCPEGTVWMSLEYVPVKGEPINLAPQLYLETETGKVFWCKD